MGVCGSLCQIRAKDQQRQVAGARYLIDLASAHAMRRQIGEAIHDLQQAGQITPEQTRTNRVARDVTRDLLQCLRTATPPRTARTCRAIRSPALACGHHLPSDVSAGVCSLSPVLARLSPSLVSICELPLMTV